MLLRSVIILKFCDSYFSHFIAWNILKSFENFWKDFSDYKHIKTQIAPKKGMCNACPKNEQYV